MNVEAEIMEKVRKIETGLSDFDRCLNVSICPRCGNKLTPTRFSCFSDVIFECTHPCKFIYRREWEE